MGSLASPIVVGGWWYLLFKSGFKHRVLYVGDHDSRDRGKRKEGGGMSCYVSATILSPSVVEKWCGLS